ncbi:MAG: hypothetical protein ACRDKY_06175 [Solirubrobacteraceae bacterium]
MTARVLPFALALAVLAAGCDYEGASKNSFVDDGNAICKETGATVIPTLQELEAEGLPSSGEVRGFVGDVVVPALSKRVNRLRQLEPPSDDRKTIDALITATQKGIGEVRSDPMQIIDGSPFLDANIEAESYGLDACVLRDAP